MGVYGIAQYAPKRVHNNTDVTNLYVSLSAGNVTEATSPVYPASVNFQVSSGVE